jgi:hypothetical protein
MLTMARRVMAFEMTVAEWIGTGLLLAVPAALVVAALSWLMLPGMCTR